MTARSVIGPGELESKRDANWGYKRMIRNLPEERRRAKKSGSAACGTKSQGKGLWLTEEDHH